MHISLSAVHATACKYCANARRGEFVSDKSNKNLTRQINAPRARSCFHSILPHRRFLREIRGIFIAPSREILENSPQKIIRRTETRTILSFSPRKIALYLRRRRLARRGGTRRRGRTYFPSLFYRM